MSDFSEVKRDPVLLKKLVEEFEEYRQFWDPLRAKFQEAKHPRLICFQELSRLSDLGHKINNLLFDYNLTIQESDSTFSGMDAANIITASLTKVVTIQLEEVKGKIQAAYQNAVGFPYVVPKSIRFDDNDNPVYEEFETPQT